MQYEIGNPREPIDDPFRLSAASVETRLWPVRRLVNGLPTDPTSVSVQAAFFAPGVDPGSFAAAAWETWAVPFGPSYFVRCLFGPGQTFPLTRGTYLPWFKFSDAPDLAVIPASRPIYVF